ncbi:MAG: hypothetical protein V1929_00710 [bacterium]
MDLTNEVIPAALWPEGNPLTTGMAVSRQLTKWRDSVAPSPEGRRLMRKTGKLLVEVPAIE